MAKPITIEILGDARGFKGALGQADRGIGGMIKNVTKLGGAIGTVFAADRLISFGAEIFTLSSNLIDMDQKISTVFGDEAADIALWADNLNEALGVSATEVELMAANIADLLKPMGATEKEAAALSKEMVELAPALAEWSGGTRTAAEVSDILAKAMLGEREMLKGLGISINQAEVNERALTVAMADGRSEITQMDKAIATQTLIMEKSTDAQDGFIVGTHTLGGQINFLKAKFADFKEELAVKLTPVFLRLGNILIERLVPALQVGAAFVRRIADRFRELWVEHGPKLRAALSEIVTAFKDLWEEQGPGLVAMLTVVRDFFSELWKDHAPKLSAAVGVVRDVLFAVIDYLRENEEVLKAAAIVIGTVIAGAFLLWAVNAGLAAAATILAAAPFILLTAAIVGFVAILIKAYEENDEFRAKVDRTVEVIRDDLMPRLEEFGRWLRDTGIPRVKELGSAIADWLRPKMQAISNYMKTDFEPDFKRGIDVLEDWHESFINGGWMIAHFVQPRYKSVSDWVNNDLIPAWDNARDKSLAWAGALWSTAFTAGKWFFKVAGFFRELPVTFSEMSAKIFLTIVDVFQRPIDWVKRKWGELVALLLTPIDIPNPFESLGGLASGIFTGNAMGTSSSPGGMFTVGERGRENVFLPRGAKVSPAHMSRESEGGNTFIINGSNLTAGQLSREMAWQQSIGDGR